MFEMIFLEGDRRGNPLRAIRDHAEYFVVEGRFEGQVVREFVVSKRKPVRQGAPDRPAQQEPQEAVIDSGRVYGKGQLRNHDDCHHIKQTNVWAIELQNLWVRFQNGFPSRKVWLIGPNPAEGCG